MGFFFCWGIYDFDDDDNCDVIFSTCFIIGTKDVFFLLCPLKWGNSDCTASPNKTRAPLQILVIFNTSFT